MNRTSYRYYVYEYWRDAKVRHWLDSWHKLPEHQLLLEPLQPWKIINFRNRFDRLVMGTVKNSCQNKLEAQQTMIWRKTIIHACWPFFGTRLILLKSVIPGGGGGGGGVLPYVCILGMCRKRDPHFQPWISVAEHIIFTNFPKIQHHHFTFFGGFCHSGDHHFQISLISTRSSPPTAGLARTQRRGLARRVLAVPESPIFSAAG